MTKKNEENENGNDNEDENVEQDVCESCEHHECSWYHEANLFLCTLCGPWVEYSLRRTEHIPYGVLAVSQRASEVLQEIRNVILDNASIRGLNGLGNWGSANCCAVPRREEGWVEFLEWILGSHADLEPVKDAIELRESTKGTGESVTAIRNQLTKQSQIGDDLIHEDGWGTWVNGVLFGPGAHDMHCHDLTILPQLLFDRLHGLDHRPVEEMAYAYQKGPWQTQIRETTSAVMPTTPALRELLTRVAVGELGQLAANRFLAATLLWAVHVEREFLTCPREAWILSFQLVRHIAEESGGKVRFEEDGIYVDAKSKNLYRIAPGGRGGDGFEVHQYSRLGNDRTTPICIHTKREPHELELAMGDVVASLVMALLDDIESAKHIHTLRAHLSNEHTRDAPDWNREDRGFRLRRRAMRHERRDERRANFVDWDLWRNGGEEEE